MKPRVIAPLFASFALACLGSAVSSPIAFRAGATSGEGRLANGAAWFERRTTPEGYPSGTLIVTLAIAPVDERAGETGLSTALALAFGDRLREETGGARCELYLEYDYAEFTVHRDPSGISDDADLRGLLQSVRSAWDRIREEPGVGAERGAGDEWYRGPDLTVVAGASSTIEALSGSIYGDFAPQNRLPPGREVDRAAYRGFCDRVLVASALAVEAETASSGALPEAFAATFGDLRASRAIDARARKLPAASLHISSAAADSGRAASFALVVPLADAGPADAAEVALHAAALLNRCRAAGLDASSSFVDVAGRMVAYWRVDAEMGGIEAFAAFMACVESLRDTPPAREELRFAVRDAMRLECDKAAASFEEGVAVSSFVRGEPYVEVRALADASAGEAFGTGAEPGRPLKDFHDWRTVFAIAVGWTLDGAAARGIIERQGDGARALDAAREAGFGAPFVPSLAEVVSTVGDGEAIGFKIVNYASITHDASYLALESGASSIGPFEGLEPISIGPGFASFAFEARDFSGKRRIVVPGRCGEPHESVAFIAWTGEFPVYVGADGERRRLYGANGASVDFSPPSGSRQEALTLSESVGGLSEYAFAYEDGEGAKFALARGAELLPDWENPFMLSQIPYAVSHDRSRSAFIASRDGSTWVVSGSTCFGPFQSAALAGWSEDGTSPRYVIARIEDGGRRFYLLEGRKILARIAPRISSRYAGDIESAPIESALCTPDGRRFAVVALGEMVTYIIESNGTSTSPSPVRNLAYASDGSAFAWATAEETLDGFPEAKSGWTLSFAVRADGKAADPASGVLSLVPLAGPELLAFEEALGLDPGLRAAQYAPFLGSGGWFVRTKEGLQGPFEEARSLVVPAESGGAEALISDSGAYWLFSDAGRAGPFERYAELCSFRGKRLALTLVDGEWNLVWGNATLGTAPVSDSPSDGPIVEFLSVSGSGVSARREVLRFVSGGRATLEIAIENGEAAWILSIDESGARARLEGGGR